MLSFADAEPQTRSRLASATPTPRRVAAPDQVAMSAPKARPPVTQAMTVLTMVLLVIAVVMASAAIAGAISPLAARREAARLIASTSTKPEMAAVAIRPELPKALRAIAEATRISARSRSEERRVGKEGRSRWSAEQ